MAAQTLGTRTTRVEEVKKLIESKFVDVLRAVAAEMTMTEMHEQRADFVQKVQPQGRRQGGSVPAPSNNKVTYGRRVQLAT